MAIRYLHNSDYTPVIQDLQLQQIVQNDQNKLIKAERYAQAEVGRYLTQRFDLTYEFTDTATWSPTKAYQPHDRVIIDYPDFNSGLTYSPNATVVYNNDGYIAIGTQSPGVFDVNKWTNLGEQYTIYYASYPAELFDYLWMYNQGDVVYWKGHTWSANIASTQLNPTLTNQYLKISDIPPYNVFPDDKFLNADHKYWQPSATYSIPVGTLPTNTIYWTQGDNRSAEIMMAYLDIVVYLLHRTISPKNIPDMRVSAYKESCRFLDSVGSGDYTLEALVLQPVSGRMIRYGGDTIQPTEW